MAWRKLKLATPLNDYRKVESKTITAQLANFSYYSFFETAYFFAWGISAQYLLAFPLKLC